MDALNLSNLYALQLPGTSLKYSFVLCLHLMSNHARISKRLNMSAVTLGICVTSKARRNFSKVP